MSLVLAVSRAWAWPVLLAVLGGLVLLTRVLLAALAAAPADAREAYRAAWRRSWRPFTTTGVALVWTLVYALYSLSLPTLGPLRELAVPGRPAPAAQEEAAPAVSVPTAAIPSLRPSAPVITLPVDDAAPPAPAVTPPPDASEPPPAEVCVAQDAGEAVKEVQKAVEQLTGRTLGADLSLVVEALAGCGDAENAALSLLGPVNQLLNDAGLGVIPLPATPDLPLPRVPEEIAAPLRPAVFEVCGQVMPQLLTITAVAPVARISTEDALRVLRYVTQVCSSFAPETT